VVLGETKLSSWESFTLLGEQKLTRALSRIAGKFSAASLNGAVFESDAAGIQAAVDYYRSAKFQQHSEDFFRPPERVPQMQISAPYPLSRGEVVDLAFPTDYQPNYQPFAAEFQRCCENKTAYLRCWRHPRGESLGTLIAIHGWMMGDSRLSAVTLVPGYFYRLGLDVLVYELPYHGRRIPSCQQQASLFPSLNFARTNEGFGQAISELRSIAKWLEQENGKPVGVMGLSLGGYTAALWASLDQLAFSILISPLVSMSEIAEVLLSVHNHVPLDLDAETLRCLSPESLSEVYAVHCPLSYAPKVELKRRMILAGVGDDIVPRTQPEEIWRHWQKPRIEWLSGGHLGQVIEAHTLRHVYDFLRELGLALDKPLEIHPLN